MFISTRKRRPHSDLRDSSFSSSRNSEVEKLLVRINSSFLSSPFRALRHLRRLQQFQRCLGSTDSTADQCSSEIPRLTAPQIWSSPCPQFKRVETGNVGWLASPFERYAGEAIWTVND